MGRLTNSTETEEINEHALPIKGNLTPDKSKSAERVKPANAILTTLVRENTRLKNKELKKHTHTQTEIFWHCGPLSFSCHTFI